MSAASAPARVLRWQDDRTEAEGWLVIDRLINGVAGGGLFMHPRATLREVADLAATMSLKNTIQRPQFGGGKGGIRFDPHSPAAVGVLRRFMLAHREVIDREWSTGGDLYTSNEAIEEIAREDLRLPSAFVALARMLSHRYGIPSQAATIAERIARPWNERFSLGQAATGYSVAESIRLLADGKPRIAIQGFGAVGSSLGHFLTHSDIGTVVGICERDGWLSSPDGIDVRELLRWRQGTGRGAAGATGFASLAATGLPAGCLWTPRKSGQSDEDLLVEFVNAVRPEAISPCATRYALTEPVMQAFVGNHGRYVVCGANNAFSSTTLAEKYRGRLTTLPEWVSNAGNAILFVEVLKTANWDDRTAEKIFAAITDRIADYLVKVGNNRDV